MSQKASYDVPEFEFASSERARAQQQPSRSEAELRPARGVAAVCAAAASMWVLAGLWHNLIMPSLYLERHATHEGIAVLALAYVVLAGLMLALFAPGDRSSKWARAGLLHGALIGILWIFPYGLAMAGAHGDPLAYVVKNSLWHIFEQGIGGLVLAAVSRRSLAQ